VGAALTSIRPMETRTTVCARWRVGVLAGSARECVGRTGGELVGVRGVRCLVPGVRSVAAGRSASRRRSVPVFGVRCGAAGRISSRRRSAPAAADAGGSPSAGASAVTRSASGTSVWGRVGLGATDGCRLLGIPDCASRVGGSTLGNCGGPTLALMGGSDWGGRRAAVVPGEVGATAEGAGGNGSGTDDVTRFLAGGRCGIGPVTGASASPSAHPSGMWRPVAAARGGSKVVRCGGATVAAPPWTLARSRAK